MTLIPRTVSQRILIFRNLPRLTLYVARAGNAEIYHAIRAVMLTKAPGIQNITE